jgi:hypothetical protein
MKWLMALLLPSSELAVIFYIINIITLLELLIINFFSPLGEIAQKSIEISTAAELKPLVDYLESTSTLHEDSGIYKINLLTLYIFIYLITMIN